MDPPFSSNFLGGDGHGPSYPRADSAGLWSRPPTPRWSPEPSYSLKSSQSPSIHKPRNITPPEDKSTEIIQSSKASAATRPQYEQVLAIAKKFEKQLPEELVSLTLSRKDFSRLREDLDFMKSADLPDSIDTKIEITAESINGFSGKYAGSEKTPDLLIKFEDPDGETRVKFVFEVGFAENYNELVKDAQGWLEGKQTIALVVLANVEELPPYKDPIRHLSDTEFAQLELPDSAEIEGSNFSMQGEYGPAVYKGLCWVGRIASVSLEIWRRDSVTGLARRHSDRIDLRNGRPFSLNLSELLGRDIEDDRTISISSVDVCSRMKKAVIASALLSPVAALPLQIRAARGLKARATLSR
ncbi:MAG: hypothetical protein Q9217_006623 [Psora testacea]